MPRPDERFGAFDYIGNSRADLPLLAQAGEAMVANPTPALRMEMRLLGKSRWPIPSSIAVRSAARCSKPFVFTSGPKYPAAGAARAFSSADAAVLGAAVVAFFCFSFMASANYLVNDLLDMEQPLLPDPSERFRPFASGDLPVSVGVVLAAALVAASAALLPLLPRAFSFWLGIYILTTMAYSLYLKRVAVVDVLLLSALYASDAGRRRGPRAPRIAPGRGIFDLFPLLFLAMVKRFSELEICANAARSPSMGAVTWSRTWSRSAPSGTASAYAVVVVFMLYIARPDVTVLYVEHVGGLGSSFLCSLAHADLAPGLPWGIIGR